MEDAKDHFQINDDNWEDMEIEDMMKSTVDILIQFPPKWLRIDGDMVR